MNLSDAKVLLTGGSSGIGLETARQLVQAGAAVVICGRDEAALAHAAQTTGAGAIRADVSQEADVIALVQRAAQQLGGLNVVINNAGFGLHAPLPALTLAGFQQVLATNVLGAFLVGREAAKHFIAQRAGNIINVASTAGQRGYATGTAYAASKFALRGMSECWRVELRPHNIRVMEVNPSEVITPFLEKVGWPVQHPERKLQAADVARAIVHLLGMDDRGFVTDITLWATNP
ncbi:SDR family oxidoreductase [Hymenobacter terrenus]|uniref:SDR family oxidoreductase n=1 Tax=Hymenobacter terrenus TaxID=1629124 RepID=UPI000619D2A9|nr:SDR family oxidoreductase [Hymenobacter terrenus]